MEQINTNPAVTHWTAPYKKHVFNVKISIQTTNVNYSEHEFGGGTIPALRHTRERSARMRKVHEAALQI